MMQIPPKQLEELEKHFGKATNNILREVTKAIQASGLQVLNTAKIKLNTGNRSGKKYKRGKKIHTASAPGEPPKTDTGRLVNSLVMRSPAKNQFKTVISLGNAAVKYANYLEFGTNKMGERPFLRPSLMENKVWIYERVIKAIKKGVADSEVK